MPFDRLPDSRTLTPEQRAACRAAVIGARYSRHRTDLPDGSCYFITDEGPGRYLLHGFVRLALRPSFCEAYRTAQGRQARIDRFVAQALARHERARRRATRP